MPANFQEQPTTYDSDYGGTTTFLDCGAGKGGKLFGAIVNTDTNIVEEYLDFTNVLWLCFNFSCFNVSLHYLERQK